MIRALLDINILLDFLNQRQFHMEAAQILNLAATKKLQAYVSAHEITTLAYFLEKEKKTHGECREVLSLVFSLTQILPVDKEILEKALHSGIEDFEDAVLEAVSLRHKVEFIVTRNVKDYSDSKVEAVNPSFFLEIFKKKSA